MATDALPYLARLRRRNRRLIRLGLAGVLGLVLVFALVLFLVPGSATRAAIASKLDAAAGGATPTICTGHRPTYTCTVTDDSGTPSATYRVTASGSCWHAVKVTQHDGAESNPPATLSGCLRLWNDVVPTL